MSETRWQNQHIDPNRNKAVDHQSPLELVEKIKENNGEIGVLLDEIEGILTL